MSSRAWPDRIQDILDAIVGSYFFIQGMSLNGYMVDNPIPSTGLGAGKALAELPVL